MIARFLAALLLVSIAASPALAEVICKEKGFRGNSRTLSMLPGDAETKARVAWVRYCERIFPKVWCSTGVAKNQRMICNGGTCEFEATPCRNN